MFTCCFLFTFCFCAFRPICFPNKIHNQNLVLDLYFRVFPHYFLNNAFFFKLNKGDAVER